MRAFAFALAAAAVLAIPSAALACGGFFCSRTPIDQAGERIAFSVKEGRVQAHIEIQYQGSAEKFAWVVPVHSRTAPALSIGSPAFFRYLGQRSQPTFQLEWEQACGGRFLSDEDLEMAPSAGGGGAEDGGVTVVSRSQVGAYDAAILLANDADALTTWLRSNDYDLSDAGVAGLRPYVGQGYYFIALKLQQNKGTGDLRPIVLDIENDVPCIPIRLTAIAARPDMPITAWVFASERAVPVNYRHVLVNESRIDWLSGGSNYVQVASDAIDEAGGRAFLTEYAGPVSTITAAGRLDDGRLDTAALASQAHPVGFVEELMRQNFPQDGLMELLRRYVPIPASLKDRVDENQFYNSIASYRSQIDADPGRAPFDAAAFAAELEETVVAPLRESQKVLDAHPYVTRLFTTMSADEMTVDPEFLFNSGLGDVSNVHRAKATCSSLDWGTPITIELANGRTFEVSFDSGPITAGPAAERIEQLSAMGPAAVVSDNAERIDEALGACGGCAGTAAPGVFALAALALLRRRRAPPRR